MIFLALLLFFSASVRNAYLDSFLRIARTSSDACKSCAPERYGRHSKKASMPMPQMQSTGTNGSGAHFKARECRPPPRALSAIYGCTPPTQKKVGWRWRDEEKSLVYEERNIKVGRSPLAGKRRRRRRRGHVGSGGSLLHSPEEARRCRFQLW